MNSIFFRPRYVLISSLCSFIFFLVIGCKSQEAVLDEKPSSQKTVTRITEFPFDSTNYTSHLSVYPHPVTMQNGLYSLKAISCVDSGDCYAISDSSSRRVILKKFSLSNKLSSTIQLDSPASLVFDSQDVRLCAADKNGGLWISAWRLTSKDYSSMSILKYTEEGNLVSSVDTRKMKYLSSRVAKSNREFAPAIIGFFCDAKQNLYLISGEDNSIKRLNSDNLVDGTFKGDDSVFVTNKGEIISLEQESEVKIRLRWLNDENSAKKEVQFTLPKFDYASLAYVREDNYFLLTWKSLSKGQSSANLYQLSSTGKIINHFVYSDASGLYSNYYKFYGNAMPTLSKKGIPIPPVIGQIIYVDRDMKIYSESATSKAYEVIRLN